MKQNSRNLDAVEMARLNIIREFVPIQTALINESRKHIAPSVSEFDLRGNVPQRISVENDDWDLQVHGRGVMFSNARTGVIVDAHVGLFDAPAAFDAWRLLQYAQSVSGRSEDYRSWQATLQRLAKSGVITPVEHHPGHFVLCNDTKSDTMSERSDLV